jgi:hypothetical protein
MIDSDLALNRVISIINKDWLLIIRNNSDLAWTRIKGKSALIIPPFVVQGQQRD